MLRRPTAALAAFAAAIALSPQASASETIPSGTLKWQQMFPGVTFAPAYGDWTKGGHGKFVRIDKGAQVPMHTHNNPYHAVFISGRMVNLFDGGQRVDIGPGDYFFMAGKKPHAHECLSDGGCFFYTYSDGLWDIHVPE